MTLRKLREAWDEFFFAPQSPIPVALFRVLYGLCVSVTVILLHGESTSGSVALAVELVRRSRMGNLVDHEASGTRYAPQPIHGHAAG